MWKIRLFPENGRHVAKKERKSGHEYYDFPNGVRSHSFKIRVRNGHADLISSSTGEVVRLKTGLIDPMRHHYSGQ